MALAQRQRAVTPSRQVRIAREDEIMAERLSGIFSANDRGFYYARFVPSVDAGTGSRESSADRSERLTSDELAFWTALGCRADEVVLSQLLIAALGSRNR